MAGVGAAAAAAYKAYQTEYDWHRAYTKPENTGSIVMSAADAETLPGEGSIWGKAKGLWHRELSSAWKSGWSEGLASDVGGTGIAIWWGAVEGPVVDVTVPAGSTVHRSGV